MRHYKEAFWVSVLGVVAPVLAAHSLQIALSRSIFHRDITLWKAKSTALRGAASGAPDAVVLGSSKSLAIDPRIIRQRSGESVLNLSVPGGFYIYQYYAVKRLLESGTPPPRLYLSMGPWSDYDPASPYLEFHERYFLSLEEVVEVSQFNPAVLQRYRETRLLGPRFLDRRIPPLWTLPRVWAGQYSNNILRKSVLENGGFFLFAEAGVRAFELGADGDGRPVYGFSHLIDGYEGCSQDYAGFHCWSSSCRHYFEKLLDMLEVSGVEYRFFFPPVSLASVDLLGVSWQSSNQDLLRRLAADDLENRVLVLSARHHSDRFCHPNSEGSRVFTNYFSEYVMARNHGALELETLSLELDPSILIDGSLPENAFRSEVRCDPVRIAISSATSRISVKLEVLNASDIAWPPLRGGEAIVLRPHLLDPRERMLHLDFPSGRALLPHRIEPGERFGVTLEIATESIPLGRSYLEFDLVHESHVWFESKGGTTCKLEINKQIHPLARTPSPAPRNSSG